LVSFHDRAIVFSHFEHSLRLCARFSFTAKKVELEKMIYEEKLKQQMGIAAIETQKVFQVQCAFPQYSTSSHDLEHNVSRS
jgi:hypothetical protein